MYIVYVQYVIILSVHVNNDCGEIFRMTKIVETKCAKSSVTMGIKSCFINLYIYTYIYIHKTPFVILTKDQMKSVDFEYLIETT